MCMCLHFIHLTEDSMTNLHSQTAFEISKYFSMRLEKNLLLFNRMRFENKRFFQNAFNFIRFGPMTF